MDYEDPSGPKVSTENFDLGLYFYNYQPVVCHFYQYGGCTRLITEIRSAIWLEMKLKSIIALFET